MEVRSMVATDKLHFDSWLLKRGRPVIPDTVLPPTDFVVYDAARPIALAYVYQTDALTGIMGWTTTSPDLDISIRKKFRAVELLIKASQAKAVSWGLGTLFHFSSASGLTNLLERSGFKVDTLNHTICVWEVSNGN